MKIYLYKAGKFNDEIAKIEVRGYTTWRIARMNEDGSLSGTHGWDTFDGRWFDREEDAEEFIAERKKTNSGPGSR